MLNFRIIQLHEVMFVYFLIDSAKVVLFSLYPLQDVSDDFE